MKIKFSNKPSKFAVDSLITTSFSYLAVGLAFYYKLLISSHLSVEEFGLFSKWLVLLGFCSIFSGMGLNISFTYFSKKKQKKALPMIKFNVLIYTAMACLIFFIFSLLKYDSIYIMTLTLAIFSTNCYSMVLSLYQVNEKFIGYNSVNFLKNGIIILGFFIFSLLSISVKVNDILIQYTVSMTTGLILILPFIWIILRSSLGTSSNFKAIQYLSYGLKSILLNFLAQGLYFFDIFIIGHYLGNKEVGIYSMGVLISKLIWVITDSIGNVIFPKLLKNSTQSIQKIILLSQVTFTIVLAAVSFYYFFGEYLISAFMKEPYKESFTSTLILLLGSQGMNIYKLLTRAHAAVNNWKPLYMTLFFSLIANIALNFILIPIMGIIGAAVASFVSYWMCGIIIIRLSGEKIIDFFDVFNVLRGACK